MQDSPILAKPGKVSPILVIGRTEIQKEKAINQIQSGLINWSLSIFLEGPREKEICSPSPSQMLQVILPLFSLLSVIWPVFAEGDIPVTATPRGKSSLEEKRQTNGAGEQNRIQELVTIL